MTEWSELEEGGKVSVIFHDGSTATGVLARSSNSLYIGNGSIFIMTQSRDGFPPSPNVTIKIIASYTPPPAIPQWHTDHTVYAVQTVTGLLIMHRNGEHWDRRVKSGGIESFTPEYLEAKYGPCSIYARYEGPVN